MSRAFHLALAALWLSSSCAWKGEGLVQRGAIGPTLQTSTGQKLRLVVKDEDRMLNHLDGHLLTLEGRKVGRNLRVTEWNIPSGLHGMNVWYGRLERKGVQLGMQDRNSGAYYLLDPGVERDLAPWVGKDVLVEGYVEGAHLVRVLHYEVLTADGPRQ